jgi:hypothetical protein
MIVAELKSLSSPDVTNLMEFKEAGEFAILLEMQVGERGRDGGDIFHLTAVSLAWTSKRVRSSGLLFTRGYLIVERFDFERVWDTLHRYCQRCSGDTWDDVERQIARVAVSEFEDYREHG